MNRGLPFGAGLVILAAWLGACAHTGVKEGSAGGREPSPPEAQIHHPRDDLPGLKNFARVSDALSRGGQPTAEGMAELAKLGFRTVVNLRIAHSDRDELRGLGLRYAHIRCKAWHPEEEDIVRFLSIATDPEN